MGKLYTVIQQDWTEHEYEPGWGASVRPDGCSFYRDIESWQRDFAENGTTRGVRDLYDTPSGEPFEVQVKKELYKEIPKGLVLRLGSHRLRELTSEGKVIQPSIKKTYNLLDNYKR